MQAGPDILFESARRAYEVGRFRFSLRALSWTFPLIAGSLYACGKLGPTIAIGCFLSAVSVFWVWRGLVLGKAVWNGIAIGTGTALIPLVAELTGKCCSLGSHVNLCVAIGLGAGAFAAYQSREVNNRSGEYLLATSVVTVCAGALGCLAMGLGEAMALSAGVFVMSLPSAAVFHLRTAQ